MYFVDTKGNSCDEGAQILTENNKIEPKQILNYITENYSKRSNDNYFFFFIMYTRG